jgi:undecaprenyl-diphosphatase
MDILQALILGVVQAITEWLPVSSSGHLALVQALFGLENNVAFDVMLHLATILVIIIVFWKDLMEIVDSLLAHSWDDNTEMLYFIAIATIPTAIIGLLFKLFFMSLFTNLLLLGIFFMINGFVLFMTKYYTRRREDLTWKGSIAIGISQGIAILPGISRSGSTISTGMFLGLKKKKLVRFSFLMAIPAIIGASILEYKDLMPLTSVGLTTILVGFFTVLILGYFCLKYLLKVIEQGRWHYFAYYCWVIGLITIVLALMF